MHAVLGIKLTARKDADSYSERLHIGVNRSSNPSSADHLLDDSW